MTRPHLRLTATLAMEVLGHANIAATMNIYTHVFDPAKRQASDVMDRLLDEDTG